MSLMNYLSAIERVYTYRIKTITPLDDTHMDWIERVLMKYVPVDITRPRRTMLQQSPLDFTNVPASEVYIVDVQTSLPLSPYVLQKEIQLALNIPERYIVVRGYNDPVEIDSEQIVATNELDAEAVAKGLVPDALINNPDYPEAQVDQPDMYGNEYNKKFLGYLHAIQKEREEASKVDAPNTLFSWLDMPKSEVADDNGEYNRDIDGAMPVKGEPTDSTNWLLGMTSNQGNVAPPKRTYRRLYGKNGERTVLSADKDTTKDPK